SGFDWETVERSRADAKRRQATNPDAYVRAEADFLVLAETRLINSALFRHAVDQTIGAVQELRRLAEESGIRLILLVTPHNQHYLDRFRRVDIEYFLERLADIAPFWNFASYSSVTTDDSNYYETSHHRPAIGAMVAARVGESRAGDIPDDFGRWVTPENVGAVLEELRPQFAERARAGLRGD
ncbi:MAG: hypothetical protein WAW79_03660, partial [Steroidobacteraceae bacterium]